MTITNVVTETSERQVKNSSYEYSKFTYKILKNITLIVTKVVELALLFETFSTSCILCSEIKCCYHICKYCCLSFKRAVVIIKYSRVCPERE